MRSMRKSTSRNQLNSVRIERSGNRLYRSLRKLLKGASSCDLAREPIPVWNLVRVLRTKPDAELVRQTTALKNGTNEISINMPSAPMPMPEGDAPALMHACLVTS